MWYNRLRPGGNRSSIYGGMAERSKAAVLKTAVGLHPPGVRIPLPPPVFQGRSLKVQSA